MAKILAYEADEDIFKIALENLNAFDFKEVTLYNNAIWDANCNLMFSSEGSVGGSVTGLDISPNEENYKNAPPGTWVGNYNTYFGVHKAKAKEVKGCGIKIC